ncbi:ribonuclease P protein subunit [Candidatus Woesearchaeota archaeon]|nr:ribonuclease P protein subunit [Candidatus Woesearchaeota archaeon]
MPQTQNIAKRELIGLEAEIIDAKNQSLVGIKGKIVDETKNTLLIEHNGKTKKVLKEDVTLNIHINNQTFQINGKVLIGRPEDRIKKLRKIKW